MKICKKPELLAPAGSFDGMRAAINAGADAVYIGGSKFGARAYAENPDEKGLLEAIDFCHIRNRKLYLTVNTLLKENELEGELYNYLLPYYEAGLDAVIVQDIGVMEFIGRYFPGLDIHVSTQASVTGTGGINGIRGLLTYPESITRVVPARELSILELKKMREETDLELEVFIQGALCYCYSGQCLLSSLAGGRSGNRGRCAQPCRKLYETFIDDNKYTGYFLSPKDMCTLGMLGELIDIKIDSFKIEGRMKSVEFAAGVVSVYREYIDRYLDGGRGQTDGHLAERNQMKISLADIKDKTDEETMNRSLSDIASEGTEFIKELYNRGGFNGGYLSEHNGRDMMSIKRNGHYGVCIGEVIRTEGRKAFIKASLPVNGGDVLEIREQGSDSSIYEYTLGEEHGKGEIFSVLTMKDRLASIGMPVFRTRNDSLLKDLRKKYLDENVKSGIKISMEARIGKPLKISMALNDICKAISESGTTVDICKAMLESGTIVSAEVYGREIQEAINSETEQDELINIVSKLGNTDFCPDNVEVDADEGIFVSVGEVKKCRRECAELLRNRILDGYRRKRPERMCVNMEKKKTQDPSIAGRVCVSVKNSNQIKWVLDSDKSGFVTDICLDMADLLQGDGLAACNNSREYGCQNVEAWRIKDDRVQNTIFGDTISGYERFIGRMIERAESILSCVAGHQKEMIFKLPRVLRNSYYEPVREFCEYFKHRASFLASNYESIALLGEMGADYRADYNIYCFNNCAKNMLLGHLIYPTDKLHDKHLEKSDCLHRTAPMGNMWKECMGYTLPVELNGAELKQLADHDGEMIVYGLIPVMVSAQCTYKTITGKCGAHEDINLKDEKGFSFRTCSECAFGYSYVYNSAVLSLFHRGTEIKNIGCTRIRAELTFEDESETRLVMRALEGLAHELFTDEISESAGLCSKNLNEKSVTGVKKMSGSQESYGFPSEIIGLKLTNGHFNRGVL